MQFELPATPAADSAADRGGPEDASTSSLPLAYGRDRIVLMVRDPSWAQVYWDISFARIKEAFGLLGGGRAFLRLLRLPANYLLSELEVWAERGSYGVALPEAERSYAAELAIQNDDRSVVLARSNVVETPATTPRPAEAPAYVSLAEQRYALEHGLSLSRTKLARADEVPQWVAGPLGGNGSISSSVWFTARDSTGSEGRLASGGSELRLSARESEERGRIAEAELASEPAAGPTEDAPPRADS
ncbi:MAG: DUF4912 domain-containing protein [Solirubrobacteraceae bacterium]